MLPPEDRQVVQAILREKARRKRWRANPALHLVERLGFRPEDLEWSLLPQYKDHKWDGTKDPFKVLCDAMANWEWICLKGAKGVGKTKVMAGLVLAFLEEYDDSIVVTTAPKQDQLDLHIWKEMKVMYPLFGRGEFTTLRLTMESGDKNWMASGFVAGVKTSDANSSATRAHGFHAEHMLIIIEEGPGVPHQVVDAFIETCSAPHNLIIMAGNPNSQFDELSKFSKTQKVRTIEISAYDHPNVVLNDANFIPGAVSMEAVVRMEAMYGKNSPVCISRVHGKTPKHAEDTLIKYDWIEAAVRREIEPTETDRKALGVDVANSEAGDLATIAHGHGNKLITIDSMACPNANDLGTKVYVIMLNEGISEENVGVDAVGVGAATVNELKRYKKEVISIIGGPEDDGKEESFENMRAQVWWTLREDLRLGLLSLPDDEELIADLLAPRFRIRNGNIIIESKDEIRKRLGRSPNKGDAAAYWNWVRTERITNEYGFGFLSKRSQSEIHADEEDDD